MKADVPDNLFVLFWDTDETFVAGQMGLSNNRVYVRCHVSGQCGALTLPADLSGVLIVEPGQILDRSRGRSDGERIRVLLGAYP
jgi:hypothetical protein